MDMCQASLRASSATSWSAAAARRIPIEALEMAVENSSRLPQRMATRIAAATTDPAMVIGLRWRPLKRRTRRQASIGHAVFGGSALGRSVVLLVGHGVAPGRGVAFVVDLLHREVGHEAVGRGAVPVLLAGLEEHAVARTDDLDLSAAAPAPAGSFRDIDGLAVGVGVPRGPGAGGEVDADRLQARLPGGRRDWVQVDRAREPVARPGRGFGAPRDLHVVAPGRVVWRHRGSWNRRGFHMIAPRTIRAGRSSRRTSSTAAAKADAGGSVGPTGEAG